MAGRVLLLFKARAELILYYLLLVDGGLQTKQTHTSFPRTYIQLEVGLNLLKPAIFFSFVFCFISPKKVVS